MKTLSCNLFTNIFKSLLSETGHSLSHKIGDLYMKLNICGGAIGQDVDDRS